MIHRVMLAAGTALLVLSGGFYFTHDDALVTIDDPQRELVLPARTTTPLTFRIHNPKLRAVRVIGLAAC
jgi:hypothetical protein